VRLLLELELLELNYQLHIEHTIHLWKHTCIHFDNIFHQKNCFLHIEHMDQHMQRQLI
jgi:hypothetical protein